MKKQGRICLPKEVYKAVKSLMIAEKIDIEFALDVYNNKYDLNTAIVRQIIKNKEKMNKNKSKRKTHDIFDVFVRVGGSFQSNC